MLALHGSARLSLVTYLMPGFALVYGALILDEAITLATLGGLALILGGVALASGAVRLPRRDGRHRPAVSVSIRPAARADLDFLVELYADEDVRPFLAAAGPLRPGRDRASEVERDPERGRRCSSSRSTASRRRDALGADATGAAGSPTSAASPSTRASAAAGSPTTPRACSSAT